MLELISRYAVTISYITVLSIVSVIVTAHDKLSAERGGRRVPEKTLLVLSALGGSAVMLLMMCLIRHKTRHKKFMIGIPLIIILQVLALFYLNKWGILI